jgi:hypothetical protein
MTCVPKPNKTVLLPGWNFTAPLAATVQISGMPSLLASGVPISTHQASSPVALPWTAA